MIRENMTTAKVMTDQEALERKRVATDLRDKLLARNIGRTYTLSEAAYIINSKEQLDTPHEHVMAELIKRYTDLLMRKEVK